MSDKVLAYVLSPLLLGTGAVLTVTEAWRFGLALCIAAVWTELLIQRLP